MNKNTMAQIWVAMYLKAKELDYSIDRYSNFRYLPAFEKLFNGVRKTLHANGYGDEHLLPAMTLDGTVRALTHQWHGYFTEQMRVVDRYRRQDVIEIIRTIPATVEIKTETRRR